MSKKWIRKLIFVGILIVISPLIMLLFRGLFYYQAYFHQGADLKKSLHIYKNLRIENEQYCKWLKNYLSEDQKMDRATQEEITSAYLRLWKLHKKSFLVLNKDIINVSFSGQLEKRLKREMDTLRKAQQQVKVDDTSHKLTLQYISNDQTVVIFNDQFSFKSRVFDAKTQNFLAQEYGDVRAYIIMTNETGFWKVRVFRWDDYYSRGSLIL